MAVATGKWRSGRICPAAALVVLQAAMLQPTDAKGAFALGLPDNVVQGGVAIGVGYNYSDREGAEARALKECLAQNAPADTRALCKVVAYFDNECVSVAMDPQPGTPGFGWAVGNTADTAKNAAIQNCRATAGADRADSCVESLTDCDTNASTAK